MLYRLVRSLLFALPPEAAHAVTLSGLQVAHRLGLLATISTHTAQSVDLMGLRFPNRLGLAAGLDKNGEYIDAVGALGFGFIEIGTVTPLPQPGNPKPRLFRLTEDRALINRMGFPNHGINRVCARLQTHRFHGICGVNIGKNATTSLDAAHADYVACLESVHAHADYVAVNISSPNTSELRRLQHGEMLRALLRTLSASRDRLKQVSGRHVPLVVKLTADLEDEELADAARITQECGFDGVIATNTTVSRDGLSSAAAKEEGGLSGVPLLARALQSVALIRTAVGPHFPVIGVGGIAGVDDALAMRAAGADLIQIYTGLVFGGPGLVREIAAKL
jgi:dihydroorotate dehydrogenase subfamily 2